MKKLILFLGSLNLLMYLGMNQMSSAKEETIKEVRSEEISISTAMLSKKEQEENQQVIEKEVTMDKNSRNELEQTSINNENLGTMGRLYIPTLNLNVAVYYANLELDDNYNAQRIVDGIDSAAYFKVGEKNVIADHNYQGFDKLLNLNIGSQAYLKTREGVTINYQLNNKFMGKNTSIDLTDTSGNSIQNMEGSLALYTCYTSEEDVVITLWSRLN